MLAVIGDVHGCYHTLARLYSVIQQNYPDIPVYCVGDLVDRGRYSFETVEFIWKNKISFTAGNHDYMFYYFIKHPSSALGRSWVYNGSESTLNSYSSKYAEMNRHLRYIINAPLIMNLNDCFISHAGISNHYSRKLGKNPLSDISKLKEIVESELNSDHGVLWTRDRLLNLGKLQIVGHTRFDEILYDEKANALYIDTAACSGNKLSAVIINENELIETISIKTIQLDIE
jgi:serine/threonine protein phosphatase 1